MTVADIVAKLWARKWLGVCLVFAFLCIASLYLRTTKYLYSAEMVLTPADQGTGKPSSRLAGLGSLVGVNLGGGQDSSFAMYSEAVKSLPVAEQLSRDPGIIRVLFSSAWDEQSGRWHEPSSRIGTVISAAKNVLGVPAVSWKPPGPQELQQFISKNVQIKEDDEKPIITLSFQHEDPRFARYFLASLNKAADSFLRRKYLARSSSYIEYIERRLKELNIVEYRMALLEQLSEHEKIRMMASSNTSFAAESFGGVLVSPRPTTPRPSIVLLVAVGAALACWASYVIVIQEAVKLIKYRTRT